jgi:tyrosyl-tRNA synthetase
MSITDELIGDYFELLTDVPDAELSEIRTQLKEQSVNPMHLKQRLARELITQLYDGGAATEAEAHFARVFQQQQTPEEITEFTIDPTENPGLRDLLVRTGLAESMSQAKRLISQGSVRINGNKISETTPPPISDGCVIQVGKRRFARIVLRP